MRELRDRGAERLIKQNLFVSVRQVVLAANHMRDAHLNVVQNDRQVVKRMAILIGAEPGLQSRNPGAVPGCGGAARRAAPRRRG